MGHTKGTLMAFLTEDVGSHKAGTKIQVLTYMAEGYSIVEEVGSDDPFRVKNDQFDFDI